MKLLIKKLKESAVVPKRATDGSAGYDLSACLDEPLKVRAGETVKIPTGLCAEIRGEEKCVMLIFARSSLATKFGLAPANCVGVVDTDYRGEILVAMRNHSDRDYTVAPGERVAQLVITPIFTPETEEVGELSDTVRGEGGFGSTN
ncbi:dUTP diphosphatase [Ruminococcus sp. Marseille-P6503]|uniref:dUTP diphosphatase n=1 Tax=Ruminococcus sp. Marseille-P6503 TaxID=2364796 RepID=UPI000F5427C1|nr:dUTP diphosphatase [Ruminococcus sp. Marseille-P6503]